MKSVTSAKLANNTRNEVHAAGGCHANRETVVCSRFVGGLIASAHTFAPFDALHHTRTDGPPNKRKMIS